MTVNAEKILAAPTSAVAVANEFIELGCKAGPTIPAIDQMKLQKLIFYAHAWYLANFNAPLFDQDFEAWPWGPVVRDVYYHTRNLGRSPITTKISTLKLNENGDFKLMVPEGVPDDIKPFISAAWDMLKNYTGIQLSNATHASGEPWTIVKDQYNGDLSTKPTIPNELIAHVFKKKLEDARKS